MSDVVVASLFMFYLYRLYLVIHFFFFVADVQVSFRCLSFVCMLCRVDRPDQSTTNGMLFWIGEMMLIPSSVVLLCLYLISYVLQCLANDSGCFLGVVHVHFTRACSPTLFSAYLQRLSEVVNRLCVI